MATAAPGQTRCYTVKAPQQGPPLIQNGVIHFQAYHIGWIISGLFAIIASAASFWLINKHIQWYTNKREQRYIVRILFMVPIYASISFASYLFWNQATPLVLLRDCYESIVLTAFFYLLLTYISPDFEEQKEVFVKLGLSRDNDLKRERSGEAPKKWIWPLTFVKWKPYDGLYFLQLMKWGVLQYCVIRPTTTFIAVVLDYVGLYCEQSWSPGWGHIYLTVTVSISVTVAMYCLIQVYITTAEKLKPHSPLLKLFAIKSVVFLTFWQATFLSMLSMFGVVKDTKYMTASNINIGIEAIAECVEMAIFAFLHIKCYTYKVYLPDSGGGFLDQRTPRLKSLGHAMNFKETFRELLQGCVYMVKHIRGKETDRMARRVVIMEEALGRSRVAVNGSEKQILNSEKLDVASVSVDVEKATYVGDECQWLGYGDDYGYGLGYITRERSGGLEEQIEKELMMRGYDADRSQTELINDGVGQSRTQLRRSWWRSVYDRSSQSGLDEKMAQPPKHKTWSRSKSKDAAVDPLLAPTYDDPPSLSLLRKYQKEAASSSVGSASGNLEMSFIGRDLQKTRAPDSSRVQTSLSAHNVVHVLDTTSQMEHASDVELERSDSPLNGVFPYTRKVNTPFADKVNTVTTRSNSSQGHFARGRTVVNTLILGDVAEIDTSDPNMNYNGRGVHPREAHVRELPKRPSHIRDSAQYTSANASLRLNLHRESPEYVRIPRRSPETRKRSLFRNAYERKFRPTKDQITLPKLLAPSSNDHNLGSGINPQAGAESYSRSKVPRTKRPTTTAPVQSTLIPIPEIRLPQRSNAVRHGPHYVRHKYPLEPIG